jgi:NADP-dependent 3-hydroxy acid dehydrogenase YdfG
MNEQPNPPFPRQHQVMPGHTERMRPTPDHGEQSYRGSGKLAGSPGADSGIGRAVAIAYAREGADIVIAYLNEHDDAKETQRLVQEAGRGAVLVAGDIGSSKHCRAIIDKAVAELGGIDILVNNAAHQATFKSIEDISDEEWELTFRVNIHAMFYLTKAAVPHMKEGGAIINTASRSTRISPTRRCSPTRRPRARSRTSRRASHSCLPRRASAPIRSRRVRSGRAHSLDDVRRNCRRVRQERADETARTTGRACDGLRDAGRSAFKLCVGRNNRGDRRKADSLGHYKPSTGRRSQTDLAYAPGRKNRERQH